MQRLRPLDETECYLRCYGWRGSEESVRVLDPDDPAARTAVAATAVTADALRAAFEAMIDSREPEAA